jgi:hypothetical protein
MKTTRGFWGILSVLVVLFTGLLAMRAEAATIGGTVTNNSGKTGSRVYLSVSGQFGGDATFGVSIPAPAPGNSAGYTVRGVPDGNYVVNAFLDRRTSTSATRHANDPVGSSQQISVAGADVPNANITLALPNPPVALQAPVLNGVLPGPGAALVSWDTPSDGNGYEIAYSYNVYWHTDSTVSPTNYTGKKTGIPARDDGMYIQTMLDPSTGTPLADGTTLWYVVTGQIGSTEGPVSNTFGPMTIGAIPSGSGAYDVSGTVTIDGGIVPAGPLLIAIASDGPNMRLGRIGSPVPGANNFTVTGVPDGNYQVYSLIDQNNDGVVWVGDYKAGDNLAPAINVSGATVSGITTSIPKRDVDASVSTSHSIDAGGHEGYGLNFSVRQDFQLPVNVAIQAGQDVSGPVDLALRTWGDFSYWVGNIQRPTPGTQYTLDLGYADGTPGSVTVAVTAVLDSFPEPVSPKGNVTFNPTPMFSWAAPASPPAGGFSYSLNLTGDNFWWSPDRLPADQTQVPFNFDGRAQGSLADNTSYTWEIAVNDLNGNQARKSATFFSGGSISGTVTGSDTGGTGVAGISVQLYDGSGGQMPWNYSTRTGADGSFVIGGLASGTYRVCFFPEQTGYVAQCYDNKSSDSFQATTIPVTSPSDTSLNPITLVRASTISGTVTASGGGAIPGVQVELRDVNGNWVPGPNQAQTDASGNYILSGFQAGSYKLYFNGASQGYIGQWYNGKSDQASADTITLAAGQSQTANAALDQGGSITGTVTVSGTQNGIQGINVGLFDQNGMWVPLNGNVMTGADGSYTIGGLVSGTYKVCFNAGSTSYIAKCYDNLAWDPWNATPIQVTAGAATAGVDAALTAGGTVTGQVTNATGGIQWVNVQLRDTSGNWVANVPGASTDQNGNYVLGGVPAGSYKVFFDGANAGYIGRWYDGAAGAADQGSATTLTIAAGETKSSIGAVLPQGGSIAGTVSDSATSTPIAGINVQVYDGSGMWVPNVQGANTDGSGNYTIGGLPDGTYKVCFSSGSTNYLAKCYDNLPADPANATPITIAGGNNVTGKNITLVLGATINGRVTFNNAGVQNVSVELRDVNGFGIPFVPQGITNASGDYTLRGIPAGTYTVYFNTGGTGYIPQWYDGKSSLGQATQISLSNGDLRNGINAALVQGGTVSGRVVNESSQPLGAAQVQLTDTNGAWLNSTTTDQNGNFTFGGLAAGNYKVQFSSFGPYYGEWYNDKQTPEAADTVVVSAGATTVLSDAVLSTRLPTVTTLMRNGADNTTFGSGVSFTASVDRFGATGLVRFLVDGVEYASQTLSNGSATAMIATIPGGTHAVTAVYAGDATNMGSSSAPVSHTVLKADQTITFDPLADRTYGDPSFPVNAWSTSNLPVTFIVVSGPAVVSNGNMVTITGAGTVTVRASQAGNGNYNPAPTADRSFTVAKASQTITFGSLVNKNFGDAPFTLGATSSSGLAVSYSLVSGPATVSGNTVTITGAGTVTVRASQGGNGNYDPAVAVDQSFTVAKASQTITFGALANKNVGDPSFTLAATASSGLTVSYTSSNPAVATVSGNTVTIVGAGTATITANQAGDGNFNAAAAVPQTLTVKSGQTITFGALAGKTYGDAPFTVSASATSGLPVTFSIVSGPATISGSTVTITGAGTVVVRASQAGDATYNPAPDVDQSFTVAKATLTITADPQTKVYGAGDPVLTYIQTGLVNGDQAAVITGSLIRAAGETVGSYAILQGSIAAGGNYTVNFVSANLTVTKATATVTLGTLNFTYDGTAKGTTATTSPAGLTVNITYDGSPTAPTNAGSYPVATAVNDPNYQGTANGTLTISKASQTITFGPLPAKNAGDPSFTLTATASSGLTVSYTSSNPAVATVSGSTVTIVGGGTATITASQAGDGNYSAAAAVPQTLTVKTGQTITFGVLAGKTYGEAAFTVSASATSGLPVTFSIVSGPATMSGSTVTITGTGSVVVRASQGGDAAYNPAPDVDQSFIVAKAGQTVSFGTLSGKTYGVAPFAVSATATSALPVSFSIVSGPATISGGTVTITGAGTVVVRASQAGNGNYSAAADVDQSFTVAKANQTISFGALAAKTALSAPFTVNATASSGLPVSFGIVSGPATVSGTTITLTGGAGQVVVRASQAGDGNFNGATDVDQSFQVAVAEGDTNMSGGPDIGDALWALQSAVGLRTLSADQRAHADVAPLQWVQGNTYVPNPDNNVDIGDALAILRKVVGLISF